MDLILDTCALLSVSGFARKKLKRKTLELIESADGLYLSACSLFEIALKHKRNQLSLKPFETAKAFWDKAISSYECEVLAIEAEDFSQAVGLPDHHNDPFDRIIVAQAIRTKSGVVTYDRQLKAYGVDLYG